MRWMCLQVVWNWIGDSGKFSSVLQVCQYGKYTDGIPVP